MEYVFGGYKPIPPQYKNVIKKLQEYPYKQNGIIPYPVVYSLFGSCLRFSKKATVAVLAELEKQGIVEVVRYNGIRIITERSQVEQGRKNRGKSRQRRLTLRR